jgi:hypothetical protein
MSSWAEWLDRPLSAWGCALGWFGATAVFMGFTRLFGGPTQSDSAQSTNATWAIAHGAVSCAYPPTKQISGIAPLYPLFSGGLSAVLRVGHSVPFPTSAAMGAHCGTAFNAMYHWYTRAGAMVPTTLIGYVGWFVLMAGLVAFLRTTGRGRTRWEPAALLLVACLPPVLMPLQEFFHPEDLMAMGLALGGLACVRRDVWAWAGLLLGLAIVTQQFALLVLAPLVVIAPRNRRIRLVGTAIGAAVVVVIPVIWITHGRLVQALAGVGATQSGGGTVLAATHIHGPVLFFASRVVPVLLALLLARWASVRSHPDPLEPAVLISLIATSLAFRLVFEVNIYGYYLMPVALSLVVMDALRGRIRVSVLVWLAAASLAFMPLPWGYDPWGNGPPIWLWQILLVPAAVVLAARPLISSLRHRSYSESHAEPPAMSVKRMASLTPRFTAASLTSVGRRT